MFIILLAGVAMEERKEDGAVIFGGGIAGGVLAGRLSTDTRVTLVDPLDYFEVPMAAPRGLVSPSVATQAIMPFAEALPNVKHLRGRLVELSPGGALVETADGKCVLVQSKVSVLATGSRFANELMRAPQGTAAERKMFYERFHKQLAAAQRILIIGGGPIGVEVAGELTQTWPGKSVTIVERGPRILAGTSPDVATHAESVLKSRGVTILTDVQIVGADESIANVFAGGGEVRTSSDLRFSYDVALWCIGGRPNTAYMQHHFGRVLTPEGRIKVASDLRVIGQQSVFALGDITDLAENKMAFHIQGQVKVAEANVRAALAGQPMPRAYRAKTGNPTMVVTLGSSMGVSHLPLFGVVRSPWMNRKIKAAHMLVPKYRKVMGR